MDSDKVRMLSWWGGFVQISSVPEPGTGQGHRDARLWGKGCGAQPCSRDSGTLWITPHKKIDYARFRQILTATCVRQGSINNGLGFRQDTVQMVCSLKTLRIDFVNVFGT